ncbi:MAG: isochorismatase family protein [Methanomicrobiales archaeon]|nr:isochorismatase family protein [Methanomicrobiales archaeon]
MKILEIGDMQNGFIEPEGNLYVSGAKSLITPANEFLRQVSSGVFDLILIVLDTHFAEEYNKCEEARQFSLHCEYGTWDWELSVDVSGLMNAHYLMKNQFNMWSDKRAKVTCNDPVRQTAYDHLFCILTDPRRPSGMVAFDDFLKKFLTGQTPVETDVTLIGVASDYCNRFSMEGWLRRGARVTIIQDLTKGISKETPQILAEDKYHQYKDGRLRAVSSAGYLCELQGPH